MTSVAVRDVSVRFEATPILRGLCLSVPSSGWVGVIGPNGAGKTTLLRAIAGLIPFEGDILLGDAPVRALNRKTVARLVAFVPQSPFIPRAITVIDYLLMGRTPYIPYLGTESSRDLEVVLGVLDRLDLRGLGARSVGSLSGGELQRVVLGRALAQEAPILLLDEPTSALDIGHQQQVLELVDDLRRGHDLTIIAAMHDLTLAGQFADSLLLLDGGRIAAAGTAHEVLTEAVITRHYSANVRVIHDQDGAILVVPTRTTSSDSPAGAGARTASSPARTASSPARTASSPS